MTLFDIPLCEPVVNVALIPQRSPFRYPGGKTWLVPHIRQWLKSLHHVPSILVEPFAGGGIIGLTAGFECLADHIVFVELDKQIAAVWKTILGGDAEWLAQRILEFEISLNSINDILSSDAEDIREIAFQTILKNRTHHGGILAHGSSMIKHGENGKGVKSRWYPETLAKRIRAIERLKDRFTFIHGDGIEIMRQYCNRHDVVFFIDPPYTAGGISCKRAGKRLYTHHEVDHELVFEVAMRNQGDFLLTYDDASVVRSLADRHSLSVKAVTMKNTHHNKMTELLIGRNLDWLGS